MGSIDPKKVFYKNMYIKELMSIYSKTRIILRQPAPFCYLRKLGLKRIFEKYTLFGSIEAPGIRLTVSLTPMNILSCKIIHGLTFCAILEKFCWESFFHRVPKM